MTVKLLTGQHFKFLSLKGDCTGSSESIHAKIPHCWKSYVAALIFIAKSCHSLRLLVIGLAYAVN